MVFTIDQEECTRCGICLKECPAQTIKQEKPGAEVKILQENCIECSHCGMVCPAGAVLAEGRRLPSLPNESELVDYEITDHLLRTKRSVRHYRNAPLLEEDLEEILKTGSLTATASNSRQCKALLLQGGEVAAASSLIAGKLLKLTNILKNPLIRLAAKGSAFSRYTNPETVRRYRTSLQKTLEGKADPIFFHAPAVVILTYPKSGKRFGRTDCALAGAHMMLSAHARSLGSCMIGFAEIALKNKAIRHKLGIPKDRKVGLVFTLGYTDRKYLRYPVRESWNGSV
jgi:nitroreductase/NAD-dependent dihydropyrimidine dehydrogenase PreA subunit